jgi:Sec-independent protein translocase protein TatA
VVALIVLGPDKMPEAMRKGGRLLGEARQWSARISEELQSAVSVSMSEEMHPSTAGPATPSAASADAAPDTTDTAPNSNEEPPSTPEEQP